MLEATTSATTRILNSLKTLEPLFIALGAIAIFGTFIWWIICQISGLTVLKEKVNRVCEDVERKIMPDIQSIKLNVKTLIDEVVGGLGVDAKLFSIGSPMVLLPKGKEFLKKSGFKKIFRENKEKFISNARSRNLKSKTDVDSASIDLVMQSLTNEQLDQLKTSAFENGISTPLMIRICAIYLRDKIIKELNIT